MVEGETTVRKLGEVANLVREMDDRLDQLVPDKCPEHDRCFERVERKLDDLDSKVDEIIVRLEKGSGEFKLQEHRISFVERILYGVIGAILLAIVAGIMALVIK